MGIESLKFEVYDYFGSTENALAWRSAHAESLQRYEKKLKSLPESRINMGWGSHNSQLFCTFVAKKELGVKSGRANMRYTRQLGL
jgi:hypothetical protein